jgi:ABC-type nitrate/sulfonate/bicarbonate transport system substrate-binding protein
MRAKTGTRQHTLTYAAHAPPGTSAEHRACFTPKRSLVRTHQAEVDALAAQLAEHLKWLQENPDAVWKALTGE